MNIVDGTVKSVIMFIYSQWRLRLILIENESKIELFYKIVLMILRFIE